MVIKIVNSILFFIYGLYMVRSSNNSKFKFILGIINILSIHVIIIDFAFPYLNKYIIFNIIEISFIIIFLVLNIYNFIKIIINSKKKNT
jgi:hypothetical protein